VGVVVSFVMYIAGAKFEEHSAVFVKERFHNAVEMDILGIFGRSFVVTNLAPPKNSSGANSSGANDVIAN